MLLNTRSNQAADQSLTMLFTLYAQLPGIVPSSSVTRAHIKQTQ